MVALETAAGGTELAAPRSHHGPEDRLHSRRAVPAPGDAARGDSRAGGAGPRARRAVSSGRAVRPAVRDLLPRLEPAARPEPVHVGRRARLGGEDPGLRVAPRAL